MKEYIIKFILGWLAGITADQWKQAVRYVQIANESLQGKTSAEKRAWVEEKIKTYIGSIYPAAMNLLIELAVSWVKKQASK